MGFATKSSMMSNYAHLFSDTIMENRKSDGIKLPNDLMMEVYLTPKGILIEVVKNGIDSHSIDLDVIFSKLIEFNIDVKIEDILMVSDFEHKEGWEDEE